jgi:hypothetical protein
LPVYPPLVLLTARFLDRWRRGAIRLAPWVMPLSLGGLVVVGAVTAVGQLVAAGVIAPTVLGDRAIVGLARWAWLGVIPILAAAFAARCLRRGQRTGLVTGLATAGVAFVGALAAFPGRTVDVQKAPWPLVAEAGACRTDEEVRIGCLAYFQPSLVFYCRREVSELATVEHAMTFLRSPWPVYVFCPADIGEALAAASAGSWHLRGRHRDLFRGGDVVVISNR